MSRWWLPAVLCLAVGCSDQRVAAPTPGPAIVKLWLCCGANNLEVPRSRQMEARATLADDTIRDVTNQVTAWRSSDPVVAPISSAGMVQALAPGAVEFGATYAGFDGTWVWNITLPRPSGPPGPSEVIGQLREVTATDTISIPRAQVEILGGPENGRLVETTGDGLFRLDGLTAAGFDLRFSKPGYWPLRFRVTDLGIDVSPATIMEPDSSTQSAVIQGDVCWPQRTITTSFTPQVDGVFRITSARGSSTLRELFVGSTLIARPFNQSDHQLQDGVTYELRITGSCDYGLAKDVYITYLRPR